MDGILGRFHPATMPLSLSRNEDMCHPQMLSHCGWDPNTWDRLRLKDIDCIQRHRQSCIFKKTLMCVFALLEESYCYVAKVPGGTLCTYPWRQDIRTSGDNAWRQTKMWLNTCNSLLLEVNKISSCREMKLTQLRRTNLNEWCTPVSLSYLYMWGSGMQISLANSIWPFFKVSKCLGLPSAVVNTTSKWLTDREQCWSLVKFVLSCL